MYTQFDEKGKIFTNVVTKKPVKVIIQTTSHMIEGCIHIRPDERIKDALKHDDNLFLAVTEAVVYDSNHQELYRSHFVTVNQAQVVYLIPIEEFIEDQSKS